MNYRDGARGIVKRALIEADRLTGILLAGRLAGLSWHEAAVRANAGAAIKVTRRGPNTAPSAAEIDDFLASVAAGG